MSTVNCIYLTRISLPGERFMSMFDGDGRPSPAQALEEEEEEEVDIPSSSNSSSSSSDSEYNSTPLESNQDTDSTDRDTDFVEVIFDGRKVTPSSAGRGKGLPNSDAKQRRHSFLLSAHKSPPSGAAAKTPLSFSSLQSERKRFMSSKASVIINSNGGHANADNNKHITPTKKGGSAGFSSPQPPSSSDHMTKDEFLKMQREVHLYGK